VHDTHVEQVLNSILAILTEIGTSGVGGFAAEGVEKAVMGTGLEGVGLALGGIKSVLGLDLIDSLGEQGMGLALGGNKVISSGWIRRQESRARKASQHGRSLGRSVFRNGRTKR
jgi:hypothetical protein